MNARKKGEKLSYFILHTYVCTVHFCALWVHECILNAFLCQFQVPVLPLSRLPPRRDEARVRPHQGRGHGQVRQEGRKVAAAATTTAAATTAATVVRAGQAAGGGGIALLPEDEDVLLQRPSSERCISFFCHIPILYALKKSIS